MNEQTHTNLSRALDGDLSDAELEQLIDSLDADPQMREQWFRMHLIGDSLRANDGGLRDLSVADRVRTHIDAEPAILAPVRRKPSVSRPALGFAIAASVAAVTVIGVLNSGQQSLPGQPAMQPASVAQTGSSASALMPVAGVPDSNQLEVSRTVGFDLHGNAHAEYVPGDDRINRYLIQHNEQQTGFGIMPYARVISFDTSEDNQ